MYQSWMRYAAVVLTFLLAWPAQARLLTWDAAVDPSGLEVIAECRLCTTSSYSEVGRVPDALEKLDFQFEPGETVSCRIKRVNMRTLEESTYSAVVGGCTGEGPMRRRFRVKPSFFP